MKRPELEPPADYKGARPGDVVRYKSLIFKCVTLVPSEHWCSHGASCRAAWDAIWCSVQLEDEEQF